jgi:hypothetical protein
VSASIDSDVWREKKCLKAAFKQNKSATPSHLTVRSGQVPARLCLLKHCLGDAILVRHTRVGELTLQKKGAHMMRSFARFGKYIRESMALTLPKRVILAFGFAALNS